jgi:hypothetical protein
LDEPVVALGVLPVGATVALVFDDGFEPVAGRAVEPLVVDFVDDDFFACELTAFFGAFVEEIVTDDSSGAPVVGGVALTCLPPLEHAAERAKTPQTATTPRTPKLPMGTPYAKTHLDGRGIRLRPTPPNCRFGHRRPSRSG